MTRSLSIAIADDEPLIRQYFHEVLTDLGHQVVVDAATGQELIDGCRAAAPDLVISDIRMPDINGIEAARRLSSERPVPTILVSAYHDPDLIRQASDAPVMAYLVKPIERADLEAAIAVSTRRFEQLESALREASTLRQSLEDRKLIERAKGILMQQTGLSEPEAFRRLQRAASDRNLKLVELARAMIAAADLLASPEPGK